MSDCPYWYRLLFSLDQNTVPLDVSGVNVSLRFSSAYDAFLMEGGSTNHLEFRQCNSSYMNYPPFENSTTIIDDGHLVPAGYTWVV
ncbi:hypothetical protein AcW1_000106 [Taiwanofungus camphoratus]|nr:hypothetical protein AcV5_004000 [Antrodia cinnamomea]KAI0962855.1 hypothetical protein AcW1_000106 [Antrodia cinnamomea]